MISKDIVIETLQKKKLQILEDQSDAASIFLTAGIVKENLAVNVVVDDNTMTVNTIDKDAGKIIDTYTVDYTEEDAVDSINNIAETYESMTKSSTQINDEAQKEKFDYILAHGKPEDFDALSLEELNALDEYIKTLDERQLSLDICHWVIQNAIDKKDAATRSKAESVEVSQEEATPVIEDAHTIPLLDLMEILANRLEDKSVEVEDEVVSRVLDDVAADVDSLRDELSKVISEEE